MECVPEDQQVALSLFVEPSPGRLVGRNGVSLHPIATRKLIKIGAGINAAVQRAQVKSRDLPGALGSFYIGAALCAAATPLSRIMIVNKRYIRMRTFHT